MCFQSIFDLCVWVCRDFDGWVDNTGSSCSGYIPLHCNRATFWAVNGVSAKDACCLCGGGTSERIHSRNWTCDLYCIMSYHGLNFKWHVIFIFIKKYKFSAFQRSLGSSFHPTNMASNMNVKTNMDMWIVGSVFHQENRILFFSNFSCSSNKSICIF